MTNNDSNGIADRLVPSVKTYHIAWHGWRDTGPKGLDSGSGNFTGTNFIDATNQWLDECLARHGYKYLQMDSFWEYNGDLT